jgi:outer membrane protein assembly factor BamE (lipoprotein component of BamABCDE complex)
MMMKRILSALMLLAACAGCSTMGVEPWDRDVLAREDSFGGGGCGCN